MGLDTVTTAAAPKAIGPYAQAVAGGGLLFLSGQIPLDPATGEVVCAGDAAGQTRQVMENLAAVLAARGLGLQHLAKTTIYLQSMGDFGAVNDVYAQALDGHRPARATVEVASLPRGVLVEIDGIALLDRQR